MADMNALMRQAQAMQQKLQAAKARLEETDFEGAAGSGLVRLTLTGAGALKGLVIDESLMEPGDGEILSDLIVAAHADAKARIEAAGQAMMRETMGPLAGMAGAIPGLKF